MNTPEAARRHARIRRSHVFDDAFTSLFPLGEGLKEPLQITFVDAFDNEEVGIDGGGITKEFLTSVVRDTFHGSSLGHHDELDEHAVPDTSPLSESFPSSPDNIPLFLENEHHLLYPNPNAIDELQYHIRDTSTNTAEDPGLLRRETQKLLAKYEFLGRIIGKCLYEGILVDVQFAGFFLLKWALTGGHGAAPRESGYRANVNDLRDLDEALYQGLVRPSPPI